jgi:hypothetical protein
MIWARRANDMQESLADERVACVHMLLHAGAEITTAVLSAATSSASAGADALCQYMASVRNTAASGGSLLIVHAEACSGKSASAAAAATAAATAAAASTGAADAMSYSATAAAAAAVTDIPLVLMV